MVNLAKNFNKKSMKFCEYFDFVLSKSGLWKIDKKKGNISTDIGDVYPPRTCRLSYH